MIPDPTDSTKWFIGSASEPSLGIQVGDVTLDNVHSEALCLGRPCVVHNPSDHGMRSWKLNWRGDKGQMERICPDHGTGHPDPDDMLYQAAQGREYLRIHGCCGCCRV